MIENGIVVALVLGLCQVLKIGGLESKWVPGAGVVVGVLATFVVPDVDLLQGVWSALLAMGMFSGVKASLK